MHHPRKGHCPPLLNQCQVPRWATRISYILLVPLSPKTRLELLKFTVPLSSKTRFHYSRYCFSNLETPRDLMMRRFLLARGAIHSKMMVMLRLFSISKNSPIRLRLRLLPQWMIRWALPLVHRGAAALGLVSAHRGGRRRQGNPEAAAREASGGGKAVHWEGRGF